MKAKRSLLADVRLAASTSFTAREVGALDELLRAVRRGADGKQIAKSPEIASVQRKLLVMQASIERNRARRYAITEGGDAE